MTNFKKIKIYSFLFILAIILLLAATYYFNNQIPRPIISNNPINHRATTTADNNQLAETAIPMAEPAVVISKLEATPSARLPSAELPSAKARGESGTGVAGSSATIGTGASTPKKPDWLNLPIPFTPQAPTGNWDLLHDEACEEASAIMANGYLTGDRDAVIPATRVEKEISDLTAWQDKNFGYHLNATAKETALMIEGFYGLQAEVFDDYTFIDIKNRLDAKQVVIIPVNGQIIGNPFYRRPGPIYHMLVIRGYDSSGLITNDSGTRRGQNYAYTFATLYNAGADWNHQTDTIDQSKKVMIVVSK